MSDFEKIKHGLVVSCQALPDEPLHSSFIMGRMALAAEQGGAVGIRANTAADILAIQKNTELPIIGIVKRDYVDAEVYITATMKEVDELLATGIEMIAIDATNRKRPNGQTLAEFAQEIRQKYHHLTLLADVATVDEAVVATKLGFDAILTTLIGYTKYSEHQNIADDDFALLRDIIAAVDIPVIAEGHIDTPEKAKRSLELGAYSVVVGGAITRPKQITKTFVSALNV